MRIIIYQGFYLDDQPSKPEWMLDAIKASKFKITEVVSTKGDEYDFGVSWASENKIPVRYFETSEELYAYADGAIAVGSIADPLIVLLSRIADKYTLQFYFHNTTLAYLQWQECEHGTPFRYPCEECSNG